jgi:hypothetical protein
MAFVATSLPNNGRTAHFAISYDDSLSNARGVDIARDLLNYCESDFALIQSWFAGVNFQFAFPISVQITGDSGGASWTGPAGHCFVVWVPPIDRRYARTSPDNRTGALPDCGGSH